MIRQNNKWLHDEPKAIGCEYLACLAGAEIATGGYLNPTDVNLIWHVGKQCDKIDPKLGLNRPDSYRWLFDKYFEYNSLDDFRGDQVGSLLNGIVSFWDWWHATAFNLVIERRVTLTGVPHSVLLDDRFKEIYNPAPWIRDGSHVGFYLFWIGPKGLWINNTDDTE